MLVVKIGGAEGIAPETLCADVAALWQQGHRFVLVHGGSAAASRLGERLGCPPRFVTAPSGYVSRYTDRSTLDIFIQATSLLNRQLVALLAAHGLPAFGVSGIDGGLLRGKRKDTIRIIEDGRQRILRDDWTGSIERVNASVLTMLLEAGMLPVVAPLALSHNAEPLNIDADRAAAMIAGALGAETLLLLSNVPGLLRELDDESSLIRSIPAQSLQQYAGVAQGRMKKKILGAQEALREGVGRVILADARRAQPVSAALNNEGTVIA